MENNHHHNPLVGMIYGIISYVAWLTSKFDLGTIQQLISTVLSTVSTVYISMQLYDYTKKKWADWRKPPPPTE